MKFTSTLFFLFITSFLFSQSLYIDFEENITTADFVDFDGGIADVIPNSQMDANNESATIARIVRDGGAIWAGSKIILDAPLDFTENSSISMKVFSTAPAGTVVKFKLEGDGQTERDVNTTVSGEWETLTWDFTGVATIYTEIVFMFDFGNTGNGSINSTFLFDDIQQTYIGEQIDFPVDFESSTVNYTMTDFGGNLYTLTEDPTNSQNNVIQVIKTTGAATWAGTTIGTNAGFATNLPLTLTDSKMSVRVWSPEAGTPIRLKVEDSNDPTHTCETETNTTVSGEWELMEFDFANQAPGTAELSVGLSMGWTYNMASIFFNFGTDGATAGEKMYYFDDVTFGPAIVATAPTELINTSIFPNPTTDFWNITNEDASIDKIEVYNSNSLLIYSTKPQIESISINALEFNAGVYFIKIYEGSSMTCLKAVKL